MMDKKIIFPVLFISILAISMASICAIELNQNQDFNGLFTMKVNSNDNFTNVGNPQDYSSLLNSKAAYKNNDSSVYVLVYDNNIQTTVDMMSGGKLSIINSATPGNSVVNEGNLYIFNSTDEMSKEMGGNATFFVGVENNGDPARSVVVCGNDANLVKEYAKTIEFKK